MNEITYVDHDEIIDVNPWATVTRWLIVVNVLVFVIDYGLTLTHHYRPMVQHDGTPFVQRLPNGHAGIIPEPVLTAYGYFSVDLALAGHQFWRFFTYQFVHANIEHIALNMMGLLLAGPLVEEKMGRIRFIIFYLICGAVGPIAHIALSQLNILQLNAYTPLIGASASIYGVLVAAARIAPDAEVMLIFPPIDVKLKTFVWFIIGLSFVAVLWRWQNAGGHAAHLGGAIAGWYLARKMLPTESANRQIGES